MKQIKQGSDVANPLKDIAIQGARREARRKFEVLKSVLAMVGAGTSMYLVAMFLYSL